MTACPNWIDIGNGERCAIVDDPENAGNYKNLRVRPWPDGRVAWHVNGERCGFRPAMREAKRAAIAFARAQIAGLA